MDSVWEQGNAEARKMLENAAESHTSAAPSQDGEPSCFTKETGASLDKLDNHNRSILQMADTQAVQSNGDGSSCPPELHRGHRSK